MSDVAIPAPSAPVSLNDAVAAALQGGVPSLPDGPLQTTTAEAVPAPATEAAAEVPPAETTTPATEQAPANTEEAPALEIDEFSLGLDEQPASAVENPQEPAAPEAKPPSDVEQFVNELAATMTRAEAEKAMGAMLRLPKGKQMLQNFKQMREVSGKLGFEPTPDEIVQFQQSYVQHNRFWDDFSSGDPQRQAQVIQGLFGAGANGEQVMGSAEFLAALPATLKQVNPQMYERIAVPIAQDMSAVFRQIATETQSEDDKARWLDAANLIDVASGITPQNGSQQETPTERALREQLQRERAANQTAASQAMVQAEKSAQGAYFQKMQTNMQSDVDRALAAVKDRVDEVTFNAYRRDIHLQLTEFVRNYHRNDVVQQRLRNTFRTAAHQRNAAPLEAEVTRARKAYESKLAELRIPYIQAAGRKAADAAQSTTAKLQQAQTKTEPAQSTAASPASVSVGIPARREGESADEYKARAVAALMGVA